MRFKTQNCRLWKTSRKSCIFKAIAVAGGSAIATNSVSAMRRFTRLTNAFSKKVANHAHAVALFTTYYNFVRIHKTLGVTPAMAAGITDRLWEIADVVIVLEK